MKMRTLSRKLLAISLSLTLLLSCMVWSGISAATVETLPDKQIAVLDLSSMPLQSNGSDAYSSAGGGNNSYTADVAVTSYVVGEDGYMSLKYPNNMVSGSDKYTAFRYFSNKRLTDTTAYTSAGNDDFRVNNGATYVVSFKYKVVSAPVAAQIRFFVVGHAWTNHGAYAVNSAFTDHLAYDLAAGVTHTEWQTCTFSFTADTSAGNGIHFAVVPADITACAGLEVQMTDITVSKPCVVTFDHNDGTGTTQTASGAPDAQVAFPADPTRAGYAFLGWNTGVDGTGDTVTAATFGADVTYYAQWKSLAAEEAWASRRIASFDFTGMPQQSGSSGDAYSSAGNGNNAVIADKVATLVTIDGNGGGYVSMKYLANDSGKYAGIRFYPNEMSGTLTDYYTSNGNQDFRAKAGVTYHVSFQYKVVSAPVSSELRFFNKGQSWASANNAASSVEHTDYLDLKLAADVTHSEWQTYTFTFTAAETTGIHFALVPDDLTACSGLEVLLTDIVISVPFAVTFDHNHDESSTVVYGGLDEAVAFPAPTRAGYDLAGWNTRADGTGDTVTAATFTEDVTYYAQWKESVTLSYIAFDTNGGQAVETLVGNAGTAATLPTATYLPYAFDGWYMNEALTVPAENVTFPATDTTVTLYAKWKTVNYNVFTSNFEAMPVRVVDGKEAGYSTTTGTGNNTAGALYVQGTDNSYMKLTSDGTTTNSHCFRLFGDIGTWQTAINGTTVVGNWDSSCALTGITYRITFKYKVVSIDAPAKLTVHVRSADLTNTTFGATGLEVYKEIGPADQSDEWQTFTDTFTADSDAAWCVGLAGCGTASVDGIVVYVDDIVMEYMPDYRKASVVFDANNGTAAVTTSQVIDEAVTYPAAPVRAGYVFAGWEDSQGTAYVASSTVAAGGITLYARWTALTSGDEVLDEITKAYQYVIGGTQDNGAITGTAGSAIYEENGVNKTAFRVAATYTAGAGFDEVVIDGSTYKVRERGLLLAVAGGDTPTLENTAAGMKVTAPTLDNYWAYNETDKTVTFTMLVKGVTQELSTKTFVARSYMKITVDGEECVVYSPVSAAFSAQSIYEAMDVKPTWFT